MGIATVHCLRPAVFSRILRIFDIDSDSSFLFQSIGARILSDDRSTRHPLGAGSPTFHPKFGGGHTHSAHRHRGRHFLGLKFGIRSHQHRRANQVCCFVALLGCRKPHIHCAWARSKVALLSSSKCRPMIKRSNPTPQRDAMKRLASMGACAWRAWAPR